MKQEVSTVVIGQLPRRWPAWFLTGEQEYLLCVCSFSHLITTLTTPTFGRIFDICTDIKRVLPVAVTLIHLVWLLS